MSQSYFFFVFRLGLFLCIFASIAEAEIHGPNEFGYSSVDSLEPGGPEFVFYDISGSGKAQNFVEAADRETLNSDDGVSVDIPLDFLGNGAGFFFYGNFRSTIHMSSNGFLTFELNDFSDDEENDCPLSDTTAQKDGIFVLHDNLVLDGPGVSSRGGYIESFDVCPYASGGTGEKCIVFQWTGEHFGGDGSVFSVQAVLYNAGKILLVYPSGNPEGGSESTTGLLDASGNDPLLQSCDSEGSIPSDYAVLLTPRSASFSYAMTVARSSRDSEIDENLCGSETSLTVARGDAVVFCYRVENNGDIPFLRHDLLDDSVGSVLSDFSFVLSPFSTTFVTEVFQVERSLVNVSQWTARTSIASTVREAQVTIFVDSDGDGTPDEGDSCPSDPKKIVLGECGCGVPDSDSDGDTTPNCEDRCPEDPKKMDVGVCGCGRSDRDSDGDKISDCHDLCPNDSLKLTPGGCGCGVQEIDSDGDGVYDCVDTCLDDPNKTREGVCGCGVWDFDTDGSGIVDCLFREESRLTLDMLISDIERLRYRRSAKSQKFLRVTIGLIVSEIEQLQSYININSAEIFSDDFAIQSAALLSSKLRKQVRRLQKRVKRKKKFNRGKSQALRVAREFQESL